MKTREILIEKIKEFQRLHGFSDRRLSTSATTSSRIIKTICSGGSATLQNIEKIEEFIDNYPNTPNTG